MKTTREKIVEEALKGFLTEGYERTSLRTVSESVEISKPAIYHYFRDKKKLLFTVQEFLLKIFDQQYEQLFQQEISLEEILEYFFTSVKNVQLMFQELTGFKIQDRFNYHRFFFDCVDKGGAPLIEKSYREQERLLAEKIKDAQELKQVSKELDAESLAFTIIALLEGTYLLSLYLPSLDIDIMAQKMLANAKRMIFIRDQEYSKKLNAR